MNWQKGDTGDFIIKNNERVRKFFKMWSTAIERGVCDERFKVDHHWDQSCVEVAVMESWKDEPKLEVWNFKTSRAMKNVVMQHYQGWGKLTLRDMCYLDRTLDFLGYTNETYHRKRALLLRENYLKITDVIY